MQKMQTCKLAKMQKAKKKMLVKDVVDVVDDVVLGVSVVLGAVNAALVVVADGKKYCVKI